jgi:hypothetical protein
MPSEPVPSVKMFGLQRTCTNVVLKGLKANFFIASRERGREWKHGKIGRSGQDIPAIVCCFREPLAWLLSMYHWSFSGDQHGCSHFRKGWSFGQFLARQHYEWPTPLDRWNALNRHYLEWLHAHPNEGIAVRSEDMMSQDDARKQYLRIGEHFGLRHRSQHIRVFQRRVNNTQVLLRRPRDFGYYGQRRYLDQYSGESLAAVAANSDPWLLEQLDYADFVRGVSIPLEATNHGTGSTST